MNSNEKRPRYMTYKALYKVYLILLKNCLFGMYSVQGNVLAVMMQNLKIYTLLENEFWRVLNTYRAPLRSRHFTYIISFNKHRNSMSWFYRTWTKDTSERSHLIWVCTCSRRQSSDLILGLYDPKPQKALLYNSAKWFAVMIQWLKLPEDSLIILLPYHT